LSRINPNDLVGKTFRCLTVLKYAGTRRSNGLKTLRNYYLCRCKCGKELEIIRHSLVGLGKKLAISCGCTRRHAKARLTHGKSSAPVYRRWLNIITRCTNSSYRKWENYGGRGIQICDRWMDFNNFYADMGDVPFIGASIDRINNNGNYEPTNCKWSTRTEQGCNKRTNRIVTFQGKTQTVSQWAREKNIPMKRLWWRLFTEKWSVEKSLTYPFISKSDRQARSTQK
jgi:hypothetical protein